jgi:hypothetical protein
MTEHTCPVCGYEGDLEFRPRDYQICGCCGTEFGYDDRTLTFEQLRAEWMQKGCPWFDPEEARPLGWNAYDQLLRAGLIPKEANSFTTGTSTRFTIGDPTLRVDIVVRVALTGDSLSPQAL